MQELPEAPDRKWDDACAREKKKKGNVPEKRKDSLSLKRDTSD